VPRTLTSVVVRGISVAGVGFLLTQFLTMGTYVALARLAPPKTFGTFAAASIVGVVTSVFTESGMTAALIQWRRNIEEAAVTALVSTVIGGILLSLLAAALAPAVGLFFRSGEITRVALAMAGIHLVSALTVVPEALLVRRFSFARAVIVEPVAWIAFAGVTIFCFVDGLGVWSLVLGTYAFTGMRVALAWGFCRWLPRLSSASWRTWRELVRFARHVVLSEILREARGVLNVALVGRVLGPSPLGEYKFGLRIASQLPAPAAQAGSYVLLPTFANIAVDRPRLGRAYLRSLRALCLVTTPLTLMLIPLGAPVAVLVFGKEWHQAGIVAACLVGMSVSSAPIQIASELFKATAKPQNLPVINLLSAVVPGVLMVAGIPFGLVGVAIGISVGTLIVGVEATRRASSIAGVPLSASAKAILPAAAGGLVSALTVLAIDRLFVNAGGQAPVEGLALAAGEFLLGILLALAIAALLAPDIANELRAGVRAVKPWRERAAVQAAQLGEIDQGSLESPAGLRVTAEP
jgi:O-antigen/teichoic acid export membrane protein